MKHPKFEKTVAREVSLILPKHEEIQEQALQLFQKHGLKSDWKFVWSNEQSHLGRCWYQRQTITLSQYWVLFLPDKEIIDTILHEIAHGLTWQSYLKDVESGVPSDIMKKMAKLYLGHGGPWEYFAKQIGANPKACYEGQIRLPNVKISR